MYNKMNLQTFAVDAKTVKAEDLKKVRDVDFTQRFIAGIETLMKMLGVTRKIEMKAGETLKVYKVTGTLENGTVAEGEVIPLSKYQTEYTAIGTAELKKWRKVTTAEAISKKGYGQAVNDTNEKMLKDIQKGIRKDFVAGFSFTVAAGAAVCFFGSAAGSAAGSAPVPVLAAVSEPASANSCNNMLKRFFIFSFLRFLKLTLVFRSFVGFHACPVSVAFYVFHAWTLVKQSAHSQTILLQYC